MHTELFIINAHSTMYQQISLGRSIEDALEGLRHAMQRHLQNRGGGGGVGDDDFVSGTWR